MLISHTRAEDLQTSTLEEVKVLEEVTDLVYNEMLPLHQVLAPFPDMQTKAKDKRMVIKLAF